MSMSMSLRAPTALIDPAWPPLNLPMVQDSTSAQPGALSPSPRTHPAVGLGLPWLPHSLAGVLGRPWLPHGEPLSHIVPSCLGRDELIKSLQ